MYMLMDRVTECSITQLSVVMRTEVDRST